jgi:hypothetical protein
MPEIAVRLPATQAERQFIGALAEIATGMTQRPEVSAA